MVNGHIIPLYSCAEIAEIEKYLEDIRQHPGYELTPVRTIGTSRAQFRVQCEERLNFLLSSTVLRNGKRPEVLAYWFMPRLTDETQLSRSERRFLENLIGSVLTQFNIALVNWHIPPWRASERRKGADLNIIMSSVRMIGILPSLVRNTEDSLWGLLRDALGYGVAAINEVRRRKEQKLIRTFDDAREERRAVLGKMPLHQQLARFPFPLHNPGDYLEALRLLGYRVNRVPASDELEISRAFCPAIDYEVLLTRPRKWRPFRVSLKLLMLETVLAQSRQRNTTVRSIEIAGPSVVSEQLSPAVPPATMEITQQNRDKSRAVERTARAEVVQQQPTRANDAPHHHHAAIPEPKRDDLQDTAHVISEKGPATEESENVSIESIV